MRALLLAPVLLGLVPASAQTTLFSESFEGTPAFTLNTTDAGSVISSWNTWVINDSYTGGDGDVICLGFPFTYSIINTPAQPGGITTPNGNYLHTASVEGIADGLTCCSFGAADGFCITADNTFSRMNTDVSTLGSADVELKFWWLCQGGSTFYGQVYYSTDGGNSWTNAGGQYNLQGSWTEATVSLPAFGNQATLRFGFRFVNSEGFGALDPGFGIDDVRVIASEAVPNSISTSSLSGSDFCQGASMSVPYTAAGTYGGGNVFSAELSDASGSFAAPTVIGTLASTTSGSITCTIPALTPVGSGYRIRVVSSQPVTVGTDNGIDIAVTAAPFAGDDDLVTICKNSGVYDMMDFIPGAAACGSWTGPGGSSSSGQFNSNADNAGNYVYTTNCPGGCPQDEATIAIVLQDPANAGNDVTASLCSNSPPPALIGYVSGGDLTGIFWYNGSTLSPDFSVPGVYDMTYVVYGTAPCINDTSDFEFTVNAAPDAGTDTTATVCTNDPPVQLLDLLGGTPDPGGAWTGPSGPTSGVFTPGTSAPGLYTYTVPGMPPCANETGVVAVLVEPCQGISEEQRARPMAWIGQEGETHLLRISSTITALDVVDAQGRVVRRLTGPFSPGLVRLVLPELRTGTYVLRGDKGAVLRIVHR